VATVDESVDDIRRQMADIRSQLHHDMTKVVEVASSATDWRSYVTDRPWLSLGAAFALGYVLVPRGVRPVVTAAAPLPLADASFRPAEPKQQHSSGLWRALRGIAGLAVPVAVRAAQGYALRWVEGYLADNPPSPLMRGMPPDFSQTRERRDAERFGYPTRG
jgi:hypothetical protein